MTVSKSGSIEGLSPSECVCFRLRRAARVAAKYYDSALKPCGLRNTQFTLLAALNLGGASSIGDLSEALAIDGTTLTRNLEILVRRNLVESVGTEDGRVRIVQLTGSGKTKLDEALPLWRGAQQSVLDALETERWVGVKRELSKIEVTCGGEE